MIKVIYEISDVLIDHMDNNRLNAVSDELKGKTYVDLVSTLWEGVGEKKMSVKDVLLD